MAGHAKKCVERYCELANKTTQQLYKVSTPCIDDHHTSKKKKWKLLENCQIHALKLLWNAYTWQELDDLIFYGSVNKLARSITKWTKACDKRPESIDFIYSSHEWIQTILSCGKILLSNADWDCFRTLTLREILKIPKSTSGGTLCVFGSHTFVPISWMCKKQTSVSHSSTESEIISLDTGTEIGWFACSGIVGSKCFCLWKYFSYFRSNGATCEWEKQIS